MLGYHLCQLPRISVATLKQTIMCVIMLQTANWMIPYLLKAYLIKVIETDALEKRIYYILSSSLQGQRF